MGSRWNSWLRKDFICCSVNASHLSGLWLRCYQTSGPRWPDHPKLHFKVSAEVRGTTDLPWWHRPADHRQRHKRGAWGEGGIKPGKGASTVLQSGAASLKGPSWKQTQCRSGAALGVLRPIPPVAPGFSAQPSSMSVAIHGHLFVEGNAVIWSFSIKMWVVAWDTSNDVHIHTLLHSLWTGMCNLGAIHKHSQARHPHFSVP